MQHIKHITVVIVLFTALLMAGCGFRPAAGASLPTATPTDEPTPVVRTDLASTEMNRLQAELDRKDAQIEQLLEDNSELRGEIVELQDQISDLNDNFDRLIDQLESESSSNEQTATATPAPQGTRETEPEANTATVPPNTTTISDWGNCSEPPADFENLPRLEIDAAVVGQWFHPIYDTSKYQSSGGFDGQWSWFHTMCLVQAEGGQFKNFENNDGRFVFRVNQTQAMAAFVVMTTEQHRAQFMDGADQFESSMNVKTLPGETVQIYDPRTGEMIGSQITSQGGDLLIVTPSNGMVGVRFPVNDPAASFEAQVWMGPDDRPNSKINRFDATELTR